MQRDVAFCHEAPCLCVTGCDCQCCRSAPSFELYLDPPDAPTKRSCGPNFLIARQCNLCVKGIAKLFSLVVSSFLQTLAHKKILGVGRSAQFLFKFTHPMATLLGTPCEYQASVLSSFFSIYFQCFIVVYPTFILCVFRCLLSFYNSQLLLIRDQKTMCRQRKLEDFAGLWPA